MFQQSPYLRFCFSTWVSLPDWQSQSSGFADLAVFNPSEGSRIGRELILKVVPQKSLAKTSLHWDSPNFLARRGLRYACNDSTSLPNPPAILLWFTSYVVQVLGYPGQCVTLVFSGNIVAKVGTTCYDI